jgi:serine/threonine protein kinase
MPFEDYKIIKEIGTGAFSVVYLAEHQQENEKESFFDNSSLFIIMEYCEGGDLEEIIKSQHGNFFEEKLIVFWFKQICLALQEIHDKIIIHRDLKVCIILVHEILRS